jgi:hypothetical protein
VLGDLHSEAGVLLAGADDEWVTSVKMTAANLVAAQLSSLLLAPCPLLAPVIVQLAIIEQRGTWGPAV